LARAQVISLLMSLLSVYVMTHIEPILVDYLGQNPTVTALAVEYITTACWAVPIRGLQDTLSRYFVNLERPPAIFLGVCNVLHFVWCWLFVGHLGLGNRGLGYANATTWSLQFVVLSVGYVFDVHRHFPTAHSDQLKAEVVSTETAEGGAITSKRAHLEPHYCYALAAVFNCTGGTTSAEASVGAQFLREVYSPAQFCAYLRISTPAMLNVMSEWVFWEVVVLAVGLLGPTATAVHAALMNVYVLAWTWNLALGAVLCQMVNKKLGQGQPCTAKLLATFLQIFGIVTAELLGLFLYAISNKIAKAFCLSGESEHLFQHVAGITLAITYVVDFTIAMGAANLRACNKNATAAMIYVIQHYGIGAPMVLYAVTGYHSLRAVWCGLLLDVSIGLLGFLYAQHRIDFGKAAEETRLRMEDEKGLKDVQNGPKP